MLKRSEAIFAVKDVKETIAFYRNVLGFEREWFWGTPVTFGGASWGDVSVMFNQQPSVAAHIEGHEHHYWSDELETLHARHQAAGAPIISPIDNKPWGLREYTVRDPNGYHLRFSGPLKYERPKSATETLPAYVHIVERKPTQQEYVDLHEAVGWSNAESSFQFVEQSVTAFLAIDTRSNRAIGMARVMNDANKWHSIWDVIVRPEHQGQHIGTAIMEAAVARINQLSPGSIVYLFTFKPDFYARVGFKNDTVTMRRL